MNIDSAVPRVGMLATVRNRRGVISAVEPFAEAGSSKLLHLVTVEFSDADGDAEEVLLWERERSPVVLEPNALPRIDVELPMPMHELLALQRATRWSAITPFLSAHSPDQRSEPVPTAPVYGAVSADDFQLVPLARAMRMPRVSLLLADDVGLGKTIEAGLILTELIRKRRIRRVLIITPASLRTQWQQEMEDKFSLGFDIVDKAATHKLQKDMGLDANPWRVLPRIITSYHYLRQPDVLEQFIANCRATQSHRGGAQLRQAVEELITASHGAIEQVQQAGNAPDYRDLYLAGSRIIMRCIITLFAEARSLLPVDNPIYQQAYSLEGLRQQLDRRAGGRGNERLTQGRSAWPRLVALFNLIYQGSAHEALPVPQYSGGLFEPGDAASQAGVARALALLESNGNSVSDRQVLNILRLLTRTRIRVRQGHKNTWVDAPVDFSALSSEYIGILYEGLLDFELKQADANDPVLFLGVGNQPALTLSQLDSMDDKTIKQLFEALSKKEKAGGDDGGGDESEEETVEDIPDDSSEDNAEDIIESDVDEPSEDKSEFADETDVELALSADDLARAQRWLEHAAELAGLVKKPKGKKATNSDYEQDRARAAKQLCARLVAPGEFYLVRWGGTRKGAGTFYTRPQLAAPTVRRTLQPLAYLPVRSEINPRSGLEDVVEWAPKTPEQILSLKICDPGMGSGSFLVGALRYLTDALVQSLYHHERIIRHADGAVARLADGKASQGLGDELLPLPRCTVNWWRCLKSCISSRSLNPTSAQCFTAKKCWITRASTHSKRVWICGVRCGFGRAMQSSMHRFQRALDSPLSKLWQLRLKWLRANAFSTGNWNFLMYSPQPVPGLMRCSATRRGKSRSPTLRSFSPTPTRCTVPMVSRMRWSNNWNTFASGRKWRLTG